MTISDDWTAQYTPYSCIKPKMIFTNQDDGNYYQLIYINYRYYIQNLATLEIKETSHSSCVEFVDHVLKEAFGEKSHLIAIPNNRLVLKIHGDEK